MNGFVSPTLIIGIGLAMMTMAAIIQTKRLEMEIADNAALVSTTREIGKTAEKLNALQVEKDRLKMEKANAQIKALSANLALVNKRLRDERARSSLVPAASPTSKRPDLACFDRGLLQSALSRFEESVAEGFESCDQRTVELNVAREWAQTPH